MFSSLFRRAPPYFVVQEIDHERHLIVVEDLNSAQRLWVPYGEREVLMAEIPDVYELLLRFTDGSQRRIDLRRHSSRK